MKSRAKLKAEVKELLLKSLLVEVNSQEWLDIVAQLKAIKKELKSKKVGYHGAP